VAVTCPACGVKATDLPDDHEMAVGVTSSGWPVLICTDGVALAGDDLRRPRGVR